ncbi:MAG: ATP synthase F1 subunit delta [bacterium]|nr:ATP synthase F1 subunit delta [bacterium]
MKDRKLAVRYARALLSFFPEPAQAEAADSFLTALHEAFDSSAELRRVLLDPAVRREVRKSVLRTLAEQKGQRPEMLNFLSMLVDNNRVGSLPSIALVFHEERERKMGIVSAEITTAQPMSSDMEARAGNAVERLTGRKVQLTCRVEPTLLGGAVTRIGSMVYDGSLRTQLAQLKRKMLQE